MRLALGAAVLLCSVCCCVKARCVPVIQKRSIFTVRFEGKCSENEKRIGAAALIAALSEGRSIDLENTIVDGPFDLGQLTSPLEESSGALSRTVKGWLTFRHCTFTSFARSGSQPLRFRSPVKFDQCVFQNQVVFDNCTFDEDLSFDRSRMLQDFSLEGSVLKKDGRFYRTWFGKNDDKDRVAKFDGTAVGGNLILEDAYGHFRVTLQGIQVGKTTDLQYAHFWFPVSIGLYGEVRPTFQGDLDARNATFEQGLQLLNGVFRGEVLLDSTFGLKLDVHSSAFDKRVLLSGKLPAEINLQDALFRSALQMERADPSEVRQVTLSDGTQVASVGLNWRAWNPARAWFWEPFVPPPATVFAVVGADPRAEDVTMGRWLTAVQTGLINLDRSAEANEVAYRKARLEESVWGMAVGDWIFGHGLRLSNPIALLLAAIVLFIPVYRRYRVYYQRGDEISLKVAALPLTVQSGFLPPDFSEASLWHQFTLSFALMIKLSFGAKYVTYRRACLAWAKAEWLIGLLLSAAVAVCVARNFPEVKELLHGIIG